MQEKGNLAVYNLVGTMDKFVLYCPQPSNRYLQNTKKMQNSISHLILPEIS